METFEFFFTRSQGFFKLNWICIAFMVQGFNLCQEILSRDFIQMAGIFSNGKKKKKREAMYRVRVLPPRGKKILSRENFLPCFLSKQMHLLRLSIGLSEVFPSAVYVPKKNLKSKFIYIFCLC